MGNYLDHGNFRHRTLRQQVADIIVSQLPQVDELQAAKLAGMIVTNMGLSIEEQDRIAQRLAITPRYRWVSPWLLMPTA